LWITNQNDHHYAVFLHPPLASSLLGLNVFLSTLYSKPISFLFPHCEKPSSINGKRKVSPVAGHEDPETEQKNSSAFSLTSALDEVGG
jgi:hypothetical protein